MAEHRLGIIMHGITGRMGLNQHLIRSIAGIIKEGGVSLSNGDKVMPDPLLLGRDLKKLSQVANENSIKRFTDDYQAAFKSSEDTLFFDAGSTQMRPSLLLQAIEANKNIYCEKPLGLKLDDAIAICTAAKKRGLKTGIVQDKLFLPGLLKLRTLIDSGSLGKILSLKIDFGYWVFDGETHPAQRPSWNYQKENGGGIIFDMMSHWQYILDNLISPVTAVSCLGVNHIRARRDENNQSYQADADDAAYVTVELEGGAIAQINSSWCTRVYRDDLAFFQVDGTKGSAVAGLTSCKYQSMENTPTPVWNPDEPQAINFYEQWKEVEGQGKYDNAFKHQWQLFIRHLYEDAPWNHTLEEGVKGVQFAEAAMKSWSDRRWVAINEIDFQHE